MQKYLLPDTLSTSTTEHPELSVYYDYFFSNRTGCAKGMGYLQELISRLGHEYTISPNNPAGSLQGKPSVQTSARSRQHHLRPDRSVP